MYGLADCGLERKDDVVVKDEDEGYVHARTCRDMHKKSSR